MNRRCYRAEREFTREIILTSPEGRRGVYRFTPFWKLIHTFQKVQILASEKVWEVWEAASCYNSPGVRKSFVLETNRYSGKFCDVFGVKCEGFAVHSRCFRYCAREQLL